MPSERKSPEAALETVSELYRVAFVVSGEGALFRAAVTARRAIGFAPAVLVLGPSASQDLEPFCEQHGLGCMRLPAGDHPSANQLLGSCLSDCAADLVCLTYNRIIPPDIVLKWEGRMINVHPSLLPAFKGNRAMDRAISEGVRFSGATIHEVIPEVDGGPIIAQAVEPIFASDDAASYGARLFPRIKVMLFQVLAWYAQGRVYREGGRLLVRGGCYGTGPISPAPEPSIAQMAEGVP